MTWFPIEDDEMEPFNPTTGEVYPLNLVVLARMLRMSVHDLAREEAEDDIPCW